jgi:DNA-binding transcriptional LysR family regulator
MELRHLRYFVAVAEELNFTRAAARLRVAQPALSSQVRDLEEELQARLFDRGHTGVQLTRAGKAFYTRARSLLSQAADAVEAARTASGSIAGTLTLGFPSGLHLNYLVPAIERFRKKHPQVEFDYFHGLPPEQLRAVKEGRIDIAFVPLSAPAKDLEHRVIWRIPYRVVLPSRHPLARRKTLELQDLRGEDFVFCPRETRPEFYDALFHHCANAGFRPRVVKEVAGYPSNMLGLVSAGAGVCVLPYFERAERMQGIVWREMTKPRLAWDWSLAWKKTGASAVAEQFAATAAALFPVPPPPDHAEY